MIHVLESQIKLEQLNVYSVYRMEMGETILLNFLGNIKRVLCIRVLQI